MTGRKTLAIALAAAAVGFGGWTLAAQGAAYDVLIRGAQVVDGTGNPYFYGDVAVKNGRIAGVGHLAGAAATRIIDAKGLVVAPGFIDMHTHSDMAVVADGTAQSKIRQGVTLDVIGEGSSVAPRDGLKAEGDQDWTTLTGYFQKLEKAGVSMNIASYVSEGQVRRVVMGYDTGPASPAQLERMKQLVARTMEEGAVGLMGRFESGGPEHPDEVIELAKVAARYPGSHYASHIGSEGYEQQKELDFALRVAREVNIPVHVLHFKIRGEKLWPKMPEYVRQVQAVRDSGFDVTANVYPYGAMSHGWSSIVPLWVREGGPEKYAERLRDKSLRPRIKADPDFIAWMEEHGGWEGVVMARARTPKNSEYEGMSVAAIAKARGDADPADTFLDLMADDGGGISGVFHNQSEENVKLVLSQPWVSPASDGSAINLQAAGVPHPRNYGTNVRVLGKYVREEHLLTLEDAVRKMTSLPAQVLGLRDRGQLREGFAADIVVFDPKTVGDTNTYEKPKSYARGVPYVLVNGVLVIDKGEHTGARPGRAILGPGYKAARAATSGQ
ncbi:MAG: D-aminoacylase [Acidobacteria bacterium]|nr:D-aminoacylase [Acidobacteriota bacterium]